MTAQRKWRKFGFGVGTIQPPQRPCNKKRRLLRKLFLNYKQSTLFWANNKAMTQRLGGVNYITYTSTHYAIIYLSISLPHFCCLKWNTTTNKTDLRLDPTENYRHMGNNILEFLRYWKQWKHHLCYGKSDFESCPCMAHNTCNSKWMRTSEKY